MTIQELKKSENFFLLAGPCVIEGEDMAMRIAERVVKMTDKLDIPYVFKGSYRKANRSRLDSFTGIGDEKALKILKKVRVFLTHLTRAVFSHQCLQVWWLSVKNQVHCQSFLIRLQSSLKKTLKIHLEILEL